MQAGRNYLLPSYFNANTAMQTKGKGCAYFMLFYKY